MRKVTVFGVFMGIGMSLSALGVVSQERDSSRAESNFFLSIRANQDESYVTFGQGFGNMYPLIFEGLISPYFLIRIRQDARWGATLSPTIILRMRNEYSFPVSTPSYMPHVTFYHQISRTSENVKYVFLTLAHHSNGQDDNFFNDDGSVNTLSGDFSTNYIELGAFFNRNVLPFENTSDYFRTSLEYHLDVGRSEELNGRYSFFRWHNSFKIFRFPIPQSTLRWLGYDPDPSTPRVQTKIETTWMFGDITNASFFDLEERFNFSFTIAYRPPALSDVSLFANFYSGKDYYNMQFFRRINVLRFGLQAYAFK